MYGSQMVVFGFAFDQGSFQSFDNGKGAVHGFKVPAAPRGTFDATLASSGIPLFALDLKHAPPDSPAAAWLSAPQQARSIGAVYSDARADQFFMNIVPRSTYDAILFVENTTAALPNSPFFASRLPQDRSDRGYLEALARRQKKPDFWRSLRAAAQNAPQKQTVDWLRTRLVARAVSGRGRTVIESYRLHKDSCYTHTVGDRLALSCIGEICGPIGDADG